MINSGRPNSNRKRKTI